MRPIEHYTLTQIWTKMIQYDERFDGDSFLAIVIHQQSYPIKGQVQLCHNLIANLFEKGTNPCKQKFLEVKSKRQVLDHFLSGISNITSYYDIFTIKILLPQPSSQPPLRVQTDDIESFFSKIYTKTDKEQTQFSQTMFHP